MSELPMALEKVLSCHYVKHGMECKPSVLVFVDALLLLVLAFLAFAAILDAINKR